MTYEEILAMVHDNTGRTDKDAAIQRYVNRSLKTLAKLRDWKELWSSADFDVDADDLTITLASSETRVVEARFFQDSSPANPWPLTHKPKKWLVSRWPNVGALSRGWPKFFYDEGGILYLYPGAANAGTLRASVIEPLASFTTGPSPLPICDDAVVAKTTAYLFKSLEQFDEAREWEATYREEVLIATRSDKRRHEERKLEEFQSPNEDLQTGQEYLDPFAGH